MSETDIIRKIKEKFGRTQIKILRALFENSEESLLSGADRLRFRANNPQWIEEIDSMESDQFLIKHSNDYTRIRISVFSLPLLDHLKASRYLSLMDKLVPILASHYREAFDSPISINILQKKLDAEIRELFDALYFFCEIGGLLRAATPEPPSIESSKFTVYEKILNTNSARERIYEAFSWRIKTPDNLRKPKTKDHNEKLSLIGTWRGQVVEITNISQRILNNNKAAIWWPLPVDRKAQKTLKTPFYLYINLLGHAIKFRLRVIDFSSVPGNTGHVSPWPEYTQEQEKNITKLESKRNQIFKTWFLIDQVLEFNDPMIEEYFEPAVPWSHQGNLLSPYRFGYAYPKSDHAFKSEAPIAELASESAEMPNYIIAGIDNATENDSLGRGRLADAIAAMLSAKEQKSPFTFAILGEWGSGKSSLIKMILKRLKESRSKNFEYAQFNAWAYESCPNMAAALAQEIISGLVNEKSWHKKLRLSLKFAYKNRKDDLIGITLISMTSIVTVILAITTYSRQVVHYFAISLGISATIVIFYLYYKCFLYFAKHPFTSFLRSFLSLPKLKHHLGITAEIKEQISLLCQLTLNKSARNKKRLIVFIDDLDRCRPSQILNVLEAVSLVTDIENVFVILAIDPRILIESAKYFQRETNNGTKLDIDILAKDYLGKIFQLLVSLDEPGKENISNFISDCLFLNITPDKIVTTHNEEIILIDKPHEHEDNDGEISSKSASKDIPKSQPSKPITLLANTKDELEQFISCSELFNIKNPRQLKRLHNSYNLLKILVPESLNIDNGKSLIKILFFKEFLQEFNKVEKKALEDYILGKHEKPALPNVSDDKIETVRFEINRCFSDFLDPLEYTRFIQLSSSVNRFIIPSI